LAIDRIRTLALTALLLGGLAWLAGCGESTTIPPPQPPQSILIGTEQNKVLWNVDRPTRGAVRYGFVSGQYDRIAYPAADASADKAFGTDHVVPLISALPDVPIYIQRTDLTEDGALYAAAEETVTFAGVPDPAALLTMTSLDVQFGDAHVLRLPSEGKTVVIDAGNPYVSRRDQSAPAHVKQWLDDRGISHIDVALATHMHVDHYGGFVWGADAAENGLLEIYTVDAFLDVADVSGNTTEHAALGALLQEEQIPRYVITDGMSDATDPDALRWDPLVAVQVLNAGRQPEWQDISHSGTRINNDSIVLKISYGEVDIVTGGDCEVEGEGRILTLYADRLAGVELFKAHHHGRYDANTPAFLAAMAPRVSFFPVAFVAYNEGPSQGAEDSAQTLGRLAALNVDVYRFDSAEPLGRVNDNRTFWHTTFVTDGTSYEVHIEPSLWGN
jgi:competence protein ComEC